MIKEELIEMLNNAQSEQSKIRAAHLLGNFFLADKHVLKILCATAIQTDSQKVREAVIQTLKISSVENEAISHFIDYANNSTKPHHRKWALTNLSFMECKTAKSTVLKGLQDSHFSVRIAAALNAALYYDENELKAFKRFFEINRFTFCLESIIAAAKLSKERILKSIEDDLRDPKNGKLPLFW